MHYIRCTLNPMVMKLPKLFHLVYNANKRNATMPYPFLRNIVMCVAALSAVVTGIAQNTRSAHVGRSIDMDAVIKSNPVPILCYHNIREWKNTDHKSDLVYIVSPENFR